MDRSWMYERLDPSRRLRKQFITGVSEFVSKAMDQTFYTLEGGIRLGSPITVHIYSLIISFL